MKPSTFFNQFHSAITSGKMLTKSTITVLCICVVYALSVTAYDCSKRPDMQNIKKCCPMPQLVSDEIKEKCKIFDNKGMQDIATAEAANGGEGVKQDRPQYNPCFMSCFINETGIFVANELNQDKMSAYVSKTFESTPDLIPVTKAAFTTCVEKQKNMKARWDELKKNQNTPELTTEAKTKADERHQCFGTAFMGFCAMKETFTNCPASVWNDSEECNDAREHIKNCKMMHGRRKPASADENN